MFHVRPGQFLIVALLFMVIGPAVTRAEWTRVEDFEGLTLGDISGQGGWSSQGTSNVVATDPAGGGNQILAVTTNSTEL